MNNIAALQDERVQQFIFEQEHMDEQQLILKGNPVFGVDAKTIAAQLAGRRKARIKLPLWYQTRGVIYPPSLNLEQSSSQATGLFKQKILREILPDSQTKTGVDLTCGLGIDSFFLGTVFKKFYAVDVNHSLLMMAKCNHQTLGFTHGEYVSVPAERFIDDHSIDFIYIDPSRRNQSQKVFKLSECEPEVVSLQDKFLKAASMVLIKGSPMLDIQQALRELKHVKSIWIVAVSNECKEVLFLQEAGWMEPPTITATELLPDGSIKSSFAFTFEQEHEAQSVFSTPQHFLYEPNAALLKAGAFKRIGAIFTLAKIDRHTHLYTSDHLIENFPGRVFKIEIANATHEQVKALQQANVLTRKYPLSPEALKRKLKLKDGGDRYVIGYTCQQERYLSIASRIL